MAIPVKTFGELHPKAKKLYEWWVSKGGSVTQPYWVPFDNISEFDQKRWAFLSCALGELPYHDRIALLPKDVTKYGDSIKEEITCWDYDEVLQQSGRDHRGGKVDGRGRSIPEGVLTYGQWVEIHPTARQHWWEFWRPTAVDLTYKTYWDYVYRWCEENPTQGHSWLVVRRLNL